MSLPVNSMSTPPTKEGEYLFYFGNASTPYFSVETLRFTVEDENGSKDWYIEDLFTHRPTLWFTLPIIAEAHHVD